MDDRPRFLDPVPASPAPQQFQTTRWSLVLAARDGGTAEAREALAALCGSYWHPLYAFIRRKGHDPEAAQDLVQGFFARLLEQGDLAAVDRAKGRFRSFLMAACAHYLANRRDYDRAWKRGGGRTPVRIDGLTAEGRYSREPAHDLTAERLFERHWALTLLGLVVDRLEAETARAGKARQFAALRPALLGGAERAPYVRIATELGLSEEAARAAAHRLRRRYRDLLREEVARTLDDPAAVDEEIRDLFGALGG
jgi:RNA polymerase sigma-70 factor (ECF subfamily)